MMLRTNHIVLKTIFLLLAGSLLFLSGCAKTNQTPGVEPSGFLKDYPKFYAGGGDDALLHWVNPLADFSLYNKVYIAPVAIYRTPNSDIDISESEQQHLEHYVYQAVAESLAQDYTIVGKPESGAMTLRMALTEAEDATVPGKIITTILPPGILISAGNKMTTGTYSFVGKATIEAEIIDSVNGERLAAAIDRRSGGKSLADAGNRWSDVEQAAEYWADRLRVRLAELRAKE